jgi:UDP-N-acetylmuramoyl-tripeptide--D-alanyl-D-alanine ligase
MQLTSTTTLLEKYKQHSYISTDSRKIMPGSIFFALKGENFNANEFAQKALDNGAAYAVIDDPSVYSGNRTLLVDNVLKALQDLASAYRSTLKIPIISITGTNGKTTTKELTAATLSTRFQTVATHGNFNNHIGVPLTVLSIKPDTEIAVVELGANHPGEIAELCKIARPTHGMITNIGKAHLEGFGGYEGVIRAKSELYHYLSDNGGQIFVNSGNELLMKLSDRSLRITYGSHKDDIVSGKPSTDKDGYLVVELTKPIKTIIQTKLAGAYNFENVMAALSVATQFRVDFEKAVQAISSYEPGMNRSQIVHSNKNVLILDAYNANPSSMKAAIINFSQMSSDNKILILGDMFELGNESEAEHKEIIKLLNGCNFSKIYTAGPYFQKVASEKRNIISFNGTSDLKEALKNNPPENALILIKGSRGMKLETIIELL